MGDRGRDVDGRPVAWRFDRYHEDDDDGSLNEQEHERRAHAQAQTCRDCAADRSDLVSAFR